jgi:DNA-3-methyladenine glycosylase
MADPPVPLSRSFYEVTPLRLAKRLIGTVIVRYLGDSVLTARIVETEAYGGSNDPASHAYRGMTDRNKVMFRSGGYAYVYFTYGMHFCFNVVAGKDGRAGAVLIRSAEPLEGIGIMQRNRGRERLRDLLSGPAKFCEALAIDRSINGLPVTAPPVYFAKGEAQTSIKILSSPRVGIKTGTDKRWRFVDSQSDFVSVKTGSSSGP